MKANINYEEIIKRVRFKYAIPIIAAKRAENLKDTEDFRKEPLAKTPDGNFVTIALKEIELGYVKLKDADKIKDINTSIRG